MILAHLTMTELGVAAALFLAGVLCGSWLTTRLARRSNALARQPTTRG